jgi:hypothetical protein
MIKLLIILHLIVPLHILSMAIFQPILEIKSLKLIFLLFIFLKEMATHPEGIPLTYPMEFQNQS